MIKNISYKVSSKVSRRFPQSISQRSADTNPQICLLVARNDLVF